MADQPFPRSRSPRFLVTIGNSTYREYGREVSNLMVDTEINGADHCRIVMTPEFDHEHASFREFDFDTVALGTDIDVEMGYGEGSNKQIFSGEIESVNPEYPADKPPLITVSAYGHTRKMMRGTHSRNWEEKSLDEIVRSVVSDYFDTVEIERTKITPSIVIQDNEKDYRFINRLATKYGYEFFSTTGTAYFRPKHGGAAPGTPVATLRYGEALESFRAEQYAPSHAEVEVRYWDREKRKVISAVTRNNSGVTGQRQVFRLTVDSQTEAKRIAEAKLLADQIEGVGESFGIPSLVAGTVVKLDGLGEKYEKNYYVTGASHRIGTNGYRMTFDVTARD